MGIELSAVIAELRTELSTAIRAGEHEDLRFELGPVELELTVVVAKDASPSAKLKFWVVEVGADSKFSSQSTQRIKLSLDPRTGSDQGKRPVIAGERAANER